MRWTEERANAWYDGQKWTVGFNFLPKTAVNSTEMWQEESYDPKEIETEIKLASETGFNSCRVFLPYIVWEIEQDKFIKRLDNFLSIAAKYNISTMFILFDDCAFAGKEPFYGKQDSPVIGVHNSGWTPSPGFKIADNLEKWPDLKKYVQTVIKTFGTDERVLVWDMYNEPGNSNREEKSLPLLKASVEWAQECNPIQPITSGVWCHKEFENDIPDLCDVVSYHCYSDVNLATKHIQEMKKYNRPIFCTEWLHRANGNTIKTHMPIFKENKIGIYNWGLVLGKTQTNLDWSTMQNKPDVNPKKWQHDLFTRDYVPYDETEITFIIDITKQ